MILLTYMLPQLRAYVLRLTEERTHTHTQTINGTYEHALRVAILLLGIIIINYAVPSVTFSAHPVDSTVSVRLSYWAEADIC